MLMLLRRIVRQVLCWHRWHYVRRVTQETTEEACFHCKARRVVYDW